MWFEIVIVRIKNRIEILLIFIGFFFFKGILVYNKKFLGNVFLNLEVMVFIKYL